jgi:PKD repeat protein
MVGAFGLLTARRITLAFAVLMIVAGMAGRLAAAAESVGPSASYTFDPGTPRSDEAITFTSTSTSDTLIVQEDWDFDDGNTASGAQVEHTYQVPGTYMVKLTVTDLLNLTATDTQAVTVENRNPVAEFHFSPTSPTAGQTVQMISDSSDPEGRIESQAWDLNNDGQYDDASGSTVSTSFAAGPHTINLLVQDMDGGTDLVSHTLNVSNPPNQVPIAEFGFSPSSPQILDNITFTSTSSDTDGSILAEDWDLDNNGTYETPGHEVQRSYLFAGDYTVNLRVTDNDGAQDYATRTVKVTAPNQQPTADFTYSPASPQRNQSIAFTSTSTDPENRIQSLQWDLDGDGQFDDASGATASRSFSTAGPHTVGLKVTDQDGGSDSTTKTVTIPNQAPKANFTWSPSNPQTLDNVTFTSTSTDDGTITEQWDLDNNGTYETPGHQAQRSFSFAGDYTINLLVTDDNGATDAKTQVVRVALPPNQQPSAKFHFTPAAPKSAEVVTFTSDSTDDGSITLAQWDFDNDGTFDATGNEVQHSYAVPDTYTVRLKVTDDRSGTHETTKAIVVSNRQPTAGFNFDPATPQKNESVSFTSTSTDPEARIQSLEWDLDGDTQFDDASGPDATKSFPAAGPHTVGLRVTDQDGGSNAITRTVTIPNQAPTASFDFAPASPSSLEDVTFTSTSTDPDGADDITKTEWDVDGNGFNDGTGVQITRSFSTPGSKSVRARVTDSAGVTSIATRLVTVQNLSPTARFDYSPAAPQKNQAVTFTSKATDPDGPPPSTIQWDFNNDGVYDKTGTSVQQTFAATGLVIVRQRVTDNNGATDEYQLAISVGGNNPPTASIGGPVTFQSLTSVTFTATVADTDGSVVKYEWDLDGDGDYDVSGATKQTVTTQYPTPGPRTVGLRVTDDDGANGTAQRAITVGNRLPNASFTASKLNTLRNQPVTLDASASTDPEGTPVMIDWDLDNNGTWEKSGTPTTVIFPTLGFKTVKLRVTDADGGSATASTVITAVNANPAADFSHFPLSPSLSESIEFDAVATDVDGTIVKYEWDFDGNRTIDATGPVVSKKFSTIGTKNVMLRVTDNDGGMAESFNPIVIGNHPPAAAFEFRPSDPVVGQQVSLFSQSSDPDNNLDPETAVWDLDGDGVFETPGRSVSKVFTGAGSYNVSLQIRDTEGEPSIATQTIVVGLPAAPKTDGARLRALSPFPLVRMAGRIGKRGTRLRLLTVDAPDGSTVTVRCKGRSCPFASSTRAASTGKLVSAARKVRIRKLERRLLRAGVTIQIYITKTGTIGKYTSIKIRSGKPPKRSDRCLMPGSTKPVQCPS